ncbi:MAG: hypothetical protein QNJ97_06725 [Myxococcota bacterium]|nr:hypothetical protein [Myxococcota bacterium]
MRTEKKAYQWSLLFICMLFIHAGFCLTGCNEEAEDALYCDAWFGTYEKQYDATGDLVRCVGELTPGCRFPDGEQVNDATTGGQVSWDFRTRGDVRLTAVKWSPLYGTQSLAVFESTPHNGHCGSGRISVTVDDGTGLKGRDILKISDDDWAAARDVVFSK